MTTVLIMHAKCDQYETFFSGTWGMTHSLKRSETNERQNASVLLSNVWVWVCEQFTAELRGPVLFILGPHTQDSKPPCHGAPASPPTPPRPSLAQRGHLATMALALAFCWACPQWGHMVPALRLCAAEGGHLISCGRLCSVHAQITINRAGFWQNLAISKVSLSESTLLGWAILWRACLLDESNIKSFHLVFDLTGP